MHKKKQQKKEKLMGKVLDRLGKKTLHSGSKRGKVVKKKVQAEAIGMSEKKGGKC